VKPEIEPVSESEEELEPQIEVKPEEVKTVAPTVVEVKSQKSDYEYYDEEEPEVKPPVQEKVVQNADLIVVPDAEKPKIIEENKPIEPTKEKVVKPPVDSKPKVPRIGELSDNFFDHNESGADDVPMTPESPSNAIIGSWNRAGKFNSGKSKGKLKDFEFAKPQGYEYSDDDYYDEEEPETPASRADDSGLSVEVQTVLSQIVEGSEPESDKPPSALDKESIKQVEVQAVSDSESNPVREKAASPN